MLQKYFYIIAAVVVVANAKVYFWESFENRDKWVDSTAKKNMGIFGLLPSKDGIKGSGGLKTSEDSKFYAISTKIDDPITNKDKNLVVSLAVRNPQGLDCGGGYIKLLPKITPKKFIGDTEYWFMFGPDKCGYTNKIHAIFNYQGSNVMWNRNIPFEDDKITHVYTFHLMPNNSYVLYVDQKHAANGTLYDDWSMLKPKVIPDPKSKKPADWVDETTIDDPNDKKPADFDKEPREITDVTVAKPEDWDDEQDGEWEVPMIPNPKYNGIWTPKRIPNPKYKGQWEPKQIPNPEYIIDKELYLIKKPIEYVGIDIWQVKSGTTFKNIIVGDDLNEVNDIIEKTWKATINLEKKTQEEENAKIKVDLEKQMAESAKEEAEKKDEKEDIKKSEDLNGKEEL